jgi:hypothetical protein
LKQSENVIEFLASNEGENEAILKRYEIEGQNVILYFDEVSKYVPLLSIKHIVPNRGFF